MRKTLEDPKGFSLLEALMALSMGVIFLVSMVSTWIYTTKVWKQQESRSQLRYDMETSIEKMKEDFRLSDGGQILFYPSSSPYTAVSLPREYPNVNGLYDIGANITWSDTIVYHIYDNELRRTQTSYSSSSATRQAQLDDIAVNGAPTLTSGTTDTLLSADSVSMGITSSNPEFDGFSATLEKSSGTSFGFGAAVLTPGSHTVRFQITGKNSSSSGYRLGLDNITLTPSGASREAEGMTVTADSGKSKTVEDMSSYSSAGSWSGNNQLEYGSSSIGDSIDFQVYNDEWLESNFSDVTHTYSEVTGTNPVLSVASRENQALNPLWRADVATSAVEADNGTAVSNTSFRNIIASTAFNRDLTMVRFKFKASSAGTSPLHVSAAYFGMQSGSSENFDLSVTPVQLYFANATVASSGTDGVGAVGSTGSTSITIPPGHYVWSNWVAFPIVPPATSQYLVSFSTDGAASSEETYWDSGSGTNAFMVSGERAAPATVWANADAGYASSSAIHALAEIQSWYHVGIVTSQVFDTKMTAPTFSNVDWDTNGSGSYLVKVRSAGNAQMTGASDWSSLSGVSSPGVISGAGTGRYVQWQATLTGASPYSTYPELDNLSVRWPGQNTMIELSGYYTKRPNYGKFKVQIDGVDVVSALEVGLTASKTLQGKTETYTVSAETKPKNTGK